MELAFKVAPIVLILIGIIGIGIRIERFNHEHITRRICNRRYIPLLNKTRYVQLLLMEMATEEQKEKAELNLKAFDFEKEMNGTKT